MKKKWQLKLVTIVKKPIFFNYAFLTIKNAIPNGVKTMQATYNEFVPLISQLNHTDKLRLMQLLLTEFTREEHITLETTHSKTKNIDALQAIANMAQPLGDENLARNFKVHKWQIIDETAQ